MHKNKLILFILFMVLILSLSECSKKEESIQTNTNQSEKQTEQSNTNKKIAGGAVQGVIIPPTKTDCTDELDTDCWNTYRNEIMPIIEVKYPQGWKLLEPMEDRKGFAIWKQDETAVNIQIQPTFPDINNLSKEEKLRDLKESYSIDRQIENIIIDHRNGFYFLGYGQSGHYLPEIILPLEDFTMFIGVDFIPRGEEQRYNKLFKVFLQTIKINQEQ